MAGSPHLLKGLLGRLFLLPLPPLCNRHLGLMYLFLAEVALHVPLHHQLQPVVQPAVLPITVVDLLLLSEDLGLSDVHLYKGKAGE